MLEINITAHMKMNYADRWKTNKYCFHTYYTARMQEMCTAEE